MLNLNRTNGLKHTCLTKRGSKIKKKLKMMSIFDQIGSTCIKCLWVLQKKECRMVIISKMYILKWVYSMQFFWIKYTDDAHLTALTMGFALHGGF